MESKEINYQETRKLDINPNFEKAYKLMESDTPVVFVTGKAGTGKSTLLHYFKEHTAKKFVVLSPTGIAALNVGGQTIHSFFSFPIHYVNPKDLKKLENPEIYKSLDCIVIDEASMVRVDVMESIDRFMRLNGRDPYKPFGGCQIILIGDLYQLLPVISRDEADFICELFDSPYFFSASVFMEVPITTVELDKVYRQKPEEQEFIALLNAIRVGEAGDRELALLRGRHNPNFSGGEYYVTLAANRYIVEQTNRFELEKLQGHTYSFIGKLEGKFKPQNCLADQTLELKESAQVMFLRNDPQGRWVNGSIGKVAGFGQDSVAVEVRSGEVYEVGKATWDMLSYNFDTRNRGLQTKVIGRFEQYPLKLAWAMTIHKAQGQTFERVAIDLGSGAFAHGQLYVALSRCTGLAGLVLKSQIRQSDMQVDRRIVEFMQT